MNGGTRFLVLAPVADVRCVGEEEVYDSPALGEPRVAASRSSPVGHLQVCFCDKDFTQPIW